MPEVTGWLCNKGHFTPYPYERTKHMVAARKRCPVCVRASDRIRQARYRGTAKGVLSKVRENATMRGN
jgi:hypothetical protein